MKRGQRGQVQEQMREEAVPFSPPAREPEAREAFAAFFARRKL